MFNHLIPLCWNTTTKLLKCRSVSDLKCFEPPPWYNIFIVPVEKQFYKPPAVWLACRFLLLWKIPPKATLHSHCSTEEVVDMALTVRSNPGAQRETGNGCWVTEVVRGTFPHASGCSSFSLVCGWSVCLHHFTPGGEGGAWEEEEGRLTVEVGENFSEGIHCPSAERTA